MKTIGKITLGFAIALSATSASITYAAAEKLTLYCSTQEDWCQLMAKGFEAASGIKVNMTRKSSGETFAQLKAEASNPKGDVWWGGTGDPHLQAAERRFDCVICFFNARWAAPLGDFASEFS